MLIIAFWVCICSHTEIYMCVNAALFMEGVLLRLSSCICLKHQPGRNMIAYHCTLNLVNRKTSCRQTSIIVPLANGVFDHCSLDENDDYVSLVYFGILWKLLTLQSSA